MYNEIQKLRNDLHWLFSTFETESSAFNLSSIRKVKAHEKTIFAIIDKAINEQNTRPQPCVDAVKALDALKEVIKGGGNIGKDGKDDGGHVWLCGNLLYDDWYTIQAALTRPKADVDLGALKLLDNEKHNDYLLCAGQDWAVGRIKGWNDAIDHLAAQGYIGDRDNECFFRWIARGKAGFNGMTLEECADIIWNRLDNPYIDNNPWEEAAPKKE